MSLKEWKPVAVFNFRGNRLRKDLPPMGLKGPGGKGAGRSKGGGEDRRRPPFFLGGKVVRELFSSAPGKLQETSLLRVRSWGLEVAEGLPGALKAERIRAFSHLRDAQFSI